MPSQIFRMPGEHRVEDMLLTARTGMKEIGKVKNLKMEEDMVVVASFPKTGSTVLMEIVWLVRNRADIAAAQRTPNWKRVPYMEINVTDTISYIKSGLPKPRTIKTHVPWRYLPAKIRNGQNKLLYAIRNPKDTLVSYYHFYKMNSYLGNFPGDWDDFFKYMMDNDGLLSMGNPLDHFLGYWEHKNDPNVLVVFYEDMVRDRENVVRRIVEFLEAELTDKQVANIVHATEFETMKASPMTNMDLKKTLPKFVPKALAPFDHKISPFLRKGKIGDWMNYMTEEQNRIVDTWCADKLAGTGLSFTYI